MVSGYNISDLFPKWTAGNPRFAVRRAARVSKRKIGITLKQLVTLAIASSPKKAMTLPQIKDWLEQNFLPTDYQFCKRWKTCVACTLSTNQEIRWTDNEEKEGNANYYTYVPHAPSDRPHRFISLCILQQSIDDFFHIFGPSDTISQLEKTTFEALLDMAKRSAKRLTG